MRHPIYSRIPPLSFGPYAHDCPRNLVRSGVIVIVRD
jgi:hypothetical protein